MRHPLTRRQMRNCLALLRETMTEFDRHCGRKLVFFNDLSFYQHIRRCAVVGKPHRQVEELLDCIGPYIPLTLTDENFELFMSAARDAEGRWNDLPDYFTQKARLDFVTLLRHIDSPDGWEWLYSICEAIRALKAELVMAEEPETATLASAPAPAPAPAVAPAKTKIETDEVH